MKPHLEIATRLADLASDLDEYRTVMTDKAHVAQAGICVETMHDLAMLLLGDDVHLVYAQDDEVTA
jgi:hypothetical protein